MKLPWKKEGQPTRAEAFILDLNQRYQENLARQQVLEKSQRELRQMFDAVSDCVFIYQADSLLLSNAEATRLLQSTEDPDLETRRIFEAAESLDSAHTTASLQLKQAQESENLHVIVRSAVEVELQEGPATLVTVEDVSDLTRLRKDVLQAAVLEQQRIGRDVHDGLGQSLTGLAFRSRSLANRTKGTEVEEAAESIARLAQVCARSGSLLARGLHQHIEREEDLDSALGLLAEYVDLTFDVPVHYQRAEGPLTASTIGHAAHPAQQENVLDQLYYIAREGTRFALRHLEATAIFIELKPGSLRLRFDSALPPADNWNGPEIDDIQRRCQTLGITGILDSDANEIWIPHGRSKI